MIIRKIVLSTIAATAILNAGFFDFFDKKEEQKKEVTVQESKFENTGSAALPENQMDGSLNINLEAIPLVPSDLQNMEMQSQVTQDESLGEPVSMEEMVGGMSEEEFQNFLSMLQSEEEREAFKQARINSAEMGVFELTIRDEDYYKNLVFARSDVFLFIMAPDARKVIKVRNSNEKVNEYMTRKYYLNETIKNSPEFINNVETDLTNLERYLDALTDLPEMEMYKEFRDKFGLDESYTEGYIREKIANYYICVYAHRVLMEQGTVADLSDKYFPKIIKTDSILGEIVRAIDPNTLYLKPGFTYDELFAATQSKMEGIENSSNKTTMKYAGDSLFNVFDVLWNEELKFAPGADLSRPEYRRLQRLAFDMMELNEYSFKRMVKHNKENKDENYINPEHYKLVPRY